MMGKIEAFYNKWYKLLLLIPALMLILSVIIIAQFYASHGDIFEKDVSLKGGISATLYLDTKVDLSDIQALLKEELGDEVFVRELSAISGTQDGFLIETSIVDVENLERIIEEGLTVDLNEENFFVEETGSKLGEDFYRQMIRALLVAFIFMGIAILITFRSIIPSFAVILSAGLDIIGTIALIDLIGIRISAAGVAALLLLVGYSVDTDVVLTTRVLKRKEGSIWNRLVGSLKTGLTMTVTALVAVGVGYLFATSLVFKQMFLIIFLGLVVDIFSTYAMNAGILKWYAERKEHG